MQVNNKHYTADEYEMYCALRRAVAVILEEYRACSNTAILDPIFTNFSPIVMQTSAGLMMVSEDGIPQAIVGPLGYYQFSEEVFLTPCSADVLDRLSKRFGLAPIKRKPPTVDPYRGEILIHALQRIDEELLPFAIPRHQGTFVPYGTAYSKWEAMTDRYNQEEERSTTEQDVQ